MYKSVFVIEAKDKVWNSNHHWSGDHPDIYPTRHKAADIAKGNPHYYIEAEDIDVNDIKVVEYNLTKAPRKNVLKVSN